MIRALITVLLFNFQLTLWSQEILMGEGRIIDAAFSPDGKTIVTASSIGLQTWDAETLTKQEFMRVPHGVRMIKWSPDGQYLFALRGNNRDHFMIGMPKFEVLYKIDYSMILPNICAAYNSNSLENSHFTLLHSNFFNFSDNSQNFVIVTDDNQMLYGSIQTGEIIKRWDYSESITVAFFEDAGQTLINNIEQIDIKTENVVGDGLGQKAHILSSDGKYIATQYYTPYSFDSDFFGMVSSDINSRNSQQRIHNFDGIGQGETTYEECWALLPHRFLFNPGIQQDIVLIHAPYLIHAPGRKVDLSERYSFNEFTTLFGSNFIKPFSPDGKRIITNVNAARQRFHDFGLSNGLRLETIGQTDQIKEFVGIHYPYQNIFFDPSQDHTLIAMQIREERENNPPSQFTIETINASSSSHQIKDGSGLIGKTNAMSNNGELLATSVYDSVENYGAIEFRNTETWHVAFSLPNQGGYEMSFIDNDQKFIYTSREIFVWDINEKKIINHLEEDEDSQEAQDSIVALDISHDQKRVLYGEYSGFLFEWNYITDEIKFIKKYDEPITDVYYINNDKEALVIFLSGTIMRHNFDTNDDITLFIPNIRRRFNPSLYLPKKNLFIFRKTIWGLETNQKVGEFAQDMEQIVKMDISPDGEWLAASFFDGTLAIWEFDDLISGNSDIQNFSNYEN